MKFLILALSFTATAAFSQASFDRPSNGHVGSRYTPYEPRSYDYERVPTDTRENSYRPGAREESPRGFAEQSLARALELLERTRLDSRDQQTVERMIQKARRVKLEHTENGPCRRGAAAYVNGGNKIYICAGFYFTARIDYGQFLILHELSHLSGIHNECQADVMARKILSDVGEPITPSGYDIQCRVN
jgi:hypothetical protein